jgi:hypothetical protein
VSNPVFETHQDASGVTPVWDEDDPCIGNAPVFVRGLVNTRLEKVVMIMPPPSTDTSSSFSKTANFSMDDH